MAGPIRHLIITPLPNGRVGNIGKVSVLLSPRLRVVGALQDYPDWRDWGNFVAAVPALQFQAVINGTPRPLNTVTVTSPAVDFQIWRAVFGPPANSQMPVRAAGFVDRSALDVTTMSSSAVASAVDALLALQAKKGDVALTKAEAEGVLGGLGAALATATTFVGQVGNGADPVAPSYDFHDVLRFLGGHPYLMRKLGLVFDLDVQLPAGAITEVAIRSNWVTKTGVGLHDEVPMRVAVDAAFRPLVSGSGYRSAGWLSLANTANYQVVEAEAINATNQLNHLQAAVNAAPAPDAAIDVPAALEAGISVTHTNIAPAYLAKLARQRVVEDAIDHYINTAAAQPPSLVAEDISMGHRLDVEDVAAPGYRSLHQRRSPTGYKFARNAAVNVVPPDDEGWVSIGLSTDGTIARANRSSAVTYAAEGQPTVNKGEERDDTEWRISDFVATWDGWSLSAGRPGTVADGSGTVKPANVSTPAPTDVTQFEVNYKVVPDSLPRLRYGHTYRLRARVVDLAGNGRGVTETPDNAATAPPTVFSRITPIPPPVPVRRRSRLDPGVGDLPAVLVIKSELAQNNSTVVPADRLFFPPRISQDRLERHDLPNGGIDPASYAAIVARDALTLTSQCLVDPETNELVAGAAVTGGQVTVGPLKPDVVYLVDPMASKVAFHGLPGAAPGTATSMALGTWPLLQAVDLELRAGTAAPLVSAPNRRVTVSLDKGTTVEIGVSTAPTSTMLSHMRAFNLLSATDRTALRPQILAGQNLAFSPRATITLVHAVRIPLSPPAFGTMTATRTVLGQTTALLDGSLLLHRATTERAELRGAWTDWLDVPTEAAPRQVAVAQVMGSIDIPVAGDAASAIVSGFGFDFGDPKRRLVDVRMEGFCRYSRYFTERKDFVLPPGGIVLLKAAGVSVGSVVLTNRTTSVVYEQGVDYSVNGATGQLTRLSTGTLVAGDLLRAEFIPLPVSRDSSEAPTGSVVTVDLPASAAPDTPVVEAVIPAFARTFTESATSLSVTHDGRVLRVLLRRPWYSSGHGELLGVAIDKSTVTTPVLTRWGRDPIRAGTGPTVRPTTTDLTRAVNVLAAADDRFDVAGHDVTYDTTRQLWTCDVAVNETTDYRPWVQLHVARFQPLAVQGAHVSNTVACEPVRLGALRTTTIETIGGGQMTVTMTGRDDVNVVRAIVQEADPTIADFDLRWHDVASYPLTRSGTTAAASFTATFALPTSGAPRRVIVEESEPTKVAQAGALVNGLVVAYREVMGIPGGW